MTRFQLNDKVTYTLLMHKRSKAGKTRPTHLNGFVKEVHTNGMVTLMLTHPDSGVVRTKKVRETDNKLQRRVE